jgi:hypothetical protein
MPMPSRRWIGAGTALVVTTLTVTAMASMPPVQAAQAACPVEPLVGESAMAMALPCNTTTRPATTRRPTTTTTLPPNTFNWSIDANVLTSLDVQEEGWLSDGDEFYIAQIGFRSTPGVPGSTSTWYQGGLTEITGLGDGSVRTIPDSMGRVTVPRVQSRGLGDILAGRNPEIVGSFSVAFESDLTSFSTINGMMTNLAGVARTEIAGLIEPLTLADLVNGQTISERLSATEKRIKSEAAPSTLDGILTFLGSLGDPDDLIAFKANVFVAVDSSLADTVDSQLGMATADGGGMAGALRDRDYTHNFAGDGASYYVDYAVRH